ncbi:DNA cytosine methyltransferase [Streptomyces californicus]|uniref:DNA cytosine methyltransferase n=1 Tax=Streptomyces californicus TaxID=67351 RepID=UPI0033B5FA98
MSILELCAGYGGLGLAVQALTGERVAYVADNAPAAATVLAERYRVPNLGDIREADWGKVAGRVDIVTAGFPCQDISTAGRGAGIHGERSGVWRNVAEAIREIRPGLVFLENVAAIRTRGIDELLGTMAALGYDAKWVCVRASAVGAPHHRDRWFCVAAPAADSGHGIESEWTRPARWESGERQAVRGIAGRGSEGASDPEKLGYPEFGEPQEHTRVLLSPRGGDTPTGDEFSPADWWGEYLPAIRRWERLTRSAPCPVEPNPRGGQRLNVALAEWMMGLPAGWVTDIAGLTRTEQLQLIGNGVVPQQAHAAYSHLLTTWGTYE